MNNDSIYNWARWLSGDIGGEASLDEDGVHIRPISEKWLQEVGERESLDLYSSPTTVLAWRTRIQYVEKMAARAILFAPIGFSCVLPESAGGERIDILRLAFGFSLSNGACCRQRYTAYYVFGKDSIFFVKGTDRLFECQVAVDILDSGARIFVDGLQKLLTFIPQIEAEYKYSSPVQKQLKISREAFSSELRDLERLYSPSYGQNITILGNPAVDLRGDDTVDVEYCDRMEDITEKYRASILFEPLTIGLITCSACLSQKKDGIDISIPFIDHPIHLP